MRYQDIVPFYQKLNYKCKREDSPDGSNKCVIEKALTEQSKSNLSIKSKTTSKGNNIIKLESGHTIRYDVNHPEMEKVANRIISILKKLPKSLQDVAKNIQLKSNDVDYIKDPSERNKERFITSARATGKLIEIFGEAPSTVTIAHEAAHILDEREEFSLANSWLKTIPIPKSNGELHEGKWVSEYAKDIAKTDLQMAIVEDFADSVGKYVATPNAFKRDFPDKALYIEQKVFKTTKQNSIQPIKLSMKHPGNWSTSDSLDSKIKKELQTGIQDVIAVLKDVGYFQEDPKEVALNEAYRKIAQEIFDTYIKLNANCSNEEKGGLTGPGSCSGGLKESSPRVDLHPKITPGDFDTMLKASKSIRNDKSEPDKVLRRMMAEEVERKFIRETKESVQAIKEASDNDIMKEGLNVWNTLSPESQSAIRGYTSSDYGVINSALVDGIERPEVPLIKASMKPLGAETILYRGVSFDMPKEVTKFGAIWKSTPFASCSTGSFIAEEAALGKLTHVDAPKIPTVLEILTSKNTKGFAVGSNSFHAAADAGSEVILDSGTKFQTLSVDKSNGIRRITVRTIDD